MSSTAITERVRPAPAGPTDAALVIAARAGEAWACEVLYRRHAGTAYGLACRMLGSKTDVEDLLQECFLTAFATLDRLDDEGAFRGWLCGMVVRKTSKLIRRRSLLSRLGLRRSLPPPDLDSVLSRSTPPDVAVELRQLYARLATFPGELRTALLLRRVDGASLEEIAQLTGASLATVKRRLKKGNMMLQDGEGGSGDE